MKIGLNRRQLLKRVFSVVGIASVTMLMAGATVWASSSGGHGEGHGGWQATDWYRVMNFAVLAVGLFLLLRKPASQALNGRIKGITQELQDLENRKAEAEKQLAEYNNRLALLDKEAERIMAEYIRQGEEARARILKEAESAADKLQAQAQKNINHEFKQAGLKLQSQIVEKALARAEEIIQKDISAADQTRLVEEYLNKVVA